MIFYHTNFVNLHWTEKVKAKYLNGVGTSTVTGSHITIALCNSSRDSQISVLTVHVVGTRTRIITKPDTKVLDLQWASVMDLVGN